MTDEIEIPAEAIEPAAPNPKPQRKKKAKKKSRKKTAKKKPVEVVAPAPAPVPEPDSAPEGEAEPAGVVQPWRSKTLLAGLAQMLLGAADKIGDEPIFQGEETPGWILLGTGLLTIVLRYLTSRPIA